MQKKQIINVKKYEFIKKNGKFLLKNVHNAYSEWSNVI